ncbi:hypothetical protein [Ferruginibacter sp. HRS2-29]|uniref:hypothetical protein n=1 Tax=Ferruginibacter sp. HRS2-29 TaxID=2487334 RepID=UPI0020CF105A|nr:hypothetical protein [Ferruginibacter sp. HRS2-29]
MKLFILLTYSFLAFLTSCNHVDKIRDSDGMSAIPDTSLQISTLEDESNQLASEKKKQLNINILLDLSDRIDLKVNPKQPAQKQRDISAIMVLCQAFKNNVAAFNVFKTQAKIKVFFYPEPNDAEIARIAKDLNVSCQAGNSGEAAKKNKVLYQNLDVGFSSGLNKIYDLATKNGKYPGSNIFRFMKDEVNNCMEDTSVFRNILVILTDGYVYDENEKYNKGNRYSYIEKSFEHFKRFRNRNLLENEFDQKNYGLIKVNDNLKNIEILVLELSPPLESPVDVDILKKYWTKWLNEMGVGKFALWPTGQPVYTEKHIADFLSY